MSAPSAMITITATRKRPSAPRGSRNSRRSAPKRRSATGGPTRTGSAVSEAGADTGIEPGRRDVGEQGTGGVDGGGDQHRAHNDRVVAGDHRIVGELADAGPGEDDLGEDRS